MLLIIVLPSHFNFVWISKVDLVKKIGSWHMKKYIFGIWFENTILQNNVLTAINTVIYMGHFFNFTNSLFYQSQSVNKNMECFT